MILLLSFKAALSLLHFVSLVAHIALIGVNQIILLNYTWLYIAITKLSKDLLLRLFCQVGMLYHLCRALLLEDLTTWTSVCNINKVSASPLQDEALGEL